MLCVLPSSPGNMKGSYVPNRQNCCKSGKCHGQQLSGLLQLSTTEKRQILVDLKEFQTPFVALCANLVNSAM